MPQRTTAGVSIYISLHPPLGLGVVHELPVVVLVSYPGRGSPLRALRPPLVRVCRLVERPRVARVLPVVVLLDVELLLLVALHEPDALGVLRGGGRSLRPASPVEAHVLGLIRDGPEAVVADVHVLVELAHGPPKPLLWTEHPESVMLKPQVAELLL